MLAKTARHPIVGGARDLTRSGVSS